MAKIESYIRNFEGMELIVIACILLFLLSIFIFLAITIFSRLRKRRKKRIVKRYTRHIEKTLFLIAFDGFSMTDLSQKNDFRKRWKKKWYRDQFLKDLIKLRRVYGGDISKNLQEFYRTSGLMKLSYEKIRSNKWYVKCEGIQELSEMGIKKAAPIIREHTNSRFETLKMVAIIELLHLKGLNGLELLKDYNEPLNDWIQLNLLDSIKNSKYNEEVPDFGYLLNAKNDSLIIFGLRLIFFFNQTQHLEEIQNLLNSPSGKIRIQAEKTVKRLSP